MSSSITEFFNGDYGFWLQFRYYGDNGIILPIGAATTKKISQLSPDNALTELPDVVFTDQNGADGIIQHQVTETEANVLGIYKYQAYVELADKAKYSEIIQFKIISPLAVA